MKVQKNTTALVCGASQGIGKAVAIELAQAGACVHAVARSEENLQNLVKELKEISSLEHSYFCADLTTSEDIEGLCDYVASHKFQILICNSGGPASGPLAEAQSSEFLNAFHAHILANQKLVQAALPSMQDSGWGRIVNIISTSVKVPIPNLGVSNTIRGAVAQWAKTLSLELGPSNITVNNVLPGYTETERLEKLLSAASKKQETPLDEIKTQWLNKVPLRRFGQAQEVAWAVQFLCSPQAAYISGINLPVDGGRTGTL